MSQRQQRAQRQARQKAANTRAVLAQHDLAQPSLLTAASRAEERFQVFMRAHPQVYREFKRRALALHRRGWRHFGAKALIEAMRYDSAISATTPDEPWRLNNSYVSRLALPHGASELRAPADADLPSRGHVVAVLPAAARAGASQTGSTVAT